ncbi:PDK, partial [Symbiodinium microadriaticum]
MWHRSLDEPPRVQGFLPLVASSPYASKREPGKPPPGYRPLQKCTVFPPGGIWLAIFTYYLDYVNDMVQIITFLLNHHYWFASFMALTQALSLCVTIYYHKQDETQIAQKKLRSRHGSAFEEGRMSLRIGVPTRQWQFLMHVEEVIEAPATGLVGAYGMSLVPTLTPIQAASGMYGLVASALAMGRGRMGYEARCRGPPRFALPVAALKSLCPTAATSALLGYQLVFAAELAIFAVVSTVLHPVVGLTGFCGGFLIDACIDVRSGADLEANGFFGGPNVSDVWSLVNVMAGRHTKVFFPTSAGCYGVIPRLFVVVRLAVFASLCSLTDLPNGLLPLGTLGRPMGHSVLQETFLDATTACRESIGCLLEGEVCWPEAGGQSVPSTMFHAALFFLALGLGSLLIVTTLGLAVYVYSVCPDMSEEMLQDIARRTSVFVRGQSDSDDKEVELLSRLGIFVSLGALEAQLQEIIDFAREREKVIARSLPGPEETETSSEESSGSLYVNRTHIVAMGRSARMLMKFARFTKIDDGSSFLARENCWFQPDIDFFAMFHDVVGDCPPGHKKEWYASATSQHAHLLREVLKHLRLLSFFDEASAPTEIQETHRTMVNALDDEACLAEFFDVR